MIEAMQHVTDRARAANIPVGVSIGADPELVCAFLEHGSSMGVDRSGCDVNASGGR